MLQGINAYSPWSGGGADSAGGGDGGGGWFSFGGGGRRPRTGRNRRKAGTGGRFSGAATAQSHASGASDPTPSPTPAAGALIAEGEQTHRAGLQYHVEYGGSAGAGAASGDEWESGSEGAYGSGSDVEDPLAPSGGGYARRLSGAARPVHLRSGGKCGALYGHVWCLGDGSSPGQPRSRWESAGFLASSTVINVLLLLFLLWSAHAPRCADVWIPTRTVTAPPQAGSVLATAVGTQQSSVLPSVRVSDEEASGSSISSSYRSETPPAVAMPPLIELKPVPALSTAELPSATRTNTDGSSLEEASSLPETPSVQTPPSSPSSVAALDVAKAMTPEEHTHAQAAEEELHQKGQKQEAAATPAPPVPTLPLEKQVALRGSTTPQPENPFPAQVSAGVDRVAVDAFQRDFDVSTSHRLQWRACKAALASPPGTESAEDSVVGVAPSQFCPETSTNEQYFQLAWFGRHVQQGFKGERRFVPKFLNCVHLPPQGYRWPAKYPALPYDGGQEGPGAVHWPNLRVNSRQELVEFNKATPKNLYHFSAFEYDQDGLAEMALAAKYIPLGSKVRLALDLGAGGGSFGLLLRRKYDITTVATAFADWPYCEYMTERGEICMLVDVMEAMPFAQRSFDLVHVSWVHHGQAPTELWDFVHETDRVLRPGGYLYLRGGWSNAQIIAQRAMYAALGYTVLYEHVAQKPAEVTKQVSFGPDLPYEADWIAIMLKPIKAVPADEATCAQRRAKEETGQVRLPLKARKTPTQEGNEYVEGAQ